MIEQITPQIADQIIARKRWPIYSTFAHCSGPCDQGDRLCMTPEACQNGSHENDEPPREPMTLLDRVFIVAAFSLAGACVYFAAMGALPYVLAFGRAIKGWLQ